MSQEYPCVHYYDDGKCKKFEEPGYTSWCVQGPCSHETPSNADRIRAMDDEELADYLAGLGSEANNGVIYSDRPEEWMEWLQLPAQGCTD